MVYATAEVLKNYERQFCRAFLFLNIIYTLGYRSLLDDGRLATEPEALILEVEVGGCDLFSCLGCSQVFNGPRNFVHALPERSGSRSFLPRTVAYVHFQAQT